ncbi:hypothetical protein U1Q18_043549 [Sarracenia purpurea var. burkii]
MSVIFTTRRTLASLVSHALSSPLFSCSSRTRFTLGILDEQPQLVPESVTIPTRSKSSSSGHSPLNDPLPNWSNQPPKETILLDGYDYDEEDAEKKIYSVCTTTYTGFGALISEELSYKVKDWLSRTNQLGILV